MERGELERANAFIVHRTVGCSIRPRETNSTKYQLDWIAMESNDQLTTTLDGSQ